MRIASADSIRFFPVCEESVTYLSFVIEASRMSLNMGSSVLLNTHFPSFCTNSPYSTACALSSPIRRDTVSKTHQKILFDMHFPLVLIQAVRDSSTFQVQGVNYGARAHRLPGHSKVETCAGAGVQPIGGQLPLHGTRQAGTLRQRLTERG